MLLFGFAFHRFHVFHVFHGQPEKFIGQHFIFPWPASKAAKSSTHAAPSPSPSPRGLVLGLLGFGRAFRTPTWKFNASTRWQPSSDRRRWRRRPVQMPDSRCRGPCSMFVVRCPIPNMNFPRNVVNKHINIRAGHMPQKEQQQQQ